MYKIWRLLFKNDPMNAKNAEITNYKIMRIFDKLT